MMAKGRRMTVMFAVATSGVGDVTENMRLFWRQLLKKSLSPSSMNWMSFSICGMGDSSYTLSFNFAAKKLHRRLLSLGAVSLLPLFLADDRHPLGSFPSLIAI